MKNIMLLGTLLVSTFSFSQEVRLGYLHGFGTDYTNASNGAFIELDRIGFQVDTGVYITQEAYEINYTADMESFDDWTPGGSFTRIGAFTTIPLKHSPLDLKLGIGTMISEGYTLTGIKSQNSMYFQAGVNINTYSDTIITINYVNSPKGNANTILVGAAFRIF